MSTPRKHHFLPQFYLRGFSVDRGSLFQIVKKSGKYYPSQIKDTAAIRDFHELDHEDVRDPNAFEKALAGVEGELAKRLQLLLSDGVGNREALSGSVQLLSQLRMRVPAMKRHIEQSFPSSIRVIAEALERSGKMPTPPEGFEEQLRVKNLRIEIRNWKCLEIMFNMATDDAHLKPLNSMRATLLHAPFGSAYITSDQPVSFFHPTAPDSLCGVGPVTPGVQITFPLSSRALLRLDNESGENASRVALSAEVREFNRRTVLMAQEYIFAAEAPEKYLDLIARNRSICAGFQFDDFRRGGGLVQVHRFVAIGPAKCDS